MSFGIFLKCFLVNDMPSSFLWNCSSCCLSLCLRSNSTLQRWVWRHHCKGSAGKKGQDWCVHREFNKDFISSSKMLIRVPYCAILVKLCNQVSSRHSCPITGPISWPVSVWKIKILILQTKGKTNRSSKIFQQKKQKQLMLFHSLQSLRGL